MVVTATLTSPPQLLQPNDDSHLITQIFQPNIYPNWKLHVFYCIWPNFLVSIFTDSLPWPPPVGFTDIKWVFQSFIASTRVGTGWWRRARIRRRMGSWEGTTSNFAFFHHDRKVDRRRRRGVRRLRSVLRLPGFTRSLFVRFLFPFLVRDCWSRSCLNRSLGMLP